MAPPDVHLVEMAHASVSRGDGYVFQLYIHVVLSFEQLAAVGLARGDLEGYDVALYMHGGKSKGKLVGDNLCMRVFGRVHRGGGGGCLTGVNGNVLAPR